MESELPFEEDSGLLHSGRGFSGYTTYIDPCRNTKEQMIAERRLSQLFLALTAIVPGTEEMDEITVLEASRKYVTQLQARVETLQNQSDSETCSSDEHISIEPLPHIEGKISGRDVLIRIDCEKRKGVVVKALEEIEKLNLCIVNSTAMPLGTSTLDITLTAQMGGEFKMTVKDLVKSLRSSLIQFTGINLHQE